MDVWAVAFSNYEPSEMIALYDNEAAAKAHAEALNEREDGDGWHAEKWTVMSEWKDAK